MGRVPGGGGPSGGPTEVPSREVGGPDVLQIRSGIGGGVEDLFKIFPPERKMETLRDSKVLPQVSVLFSE